VRNATLVCGLLSGLLLLSTGCASTHRSPGWVRTGDPVADGRAAIAGAPEKDRTLWQCRTALELMRRSQFAEARSLLDDVLLSIGSNSAGDREAKKARSLFSSESRKPFRGEPYEQVMAYFYRGLLYWHDGEPDNARACFRNAQLRDSDTENRQYSSDYVLLEYLEGLATAKLGGDGSDAFNRATALRQPAPPPLNPAANTLFFVEFGRGPSKYASGDYAEELRIRPGKSAAQSVSITVGRQSLNFGPYDNLSFQATTRGGRLMDHILENKAVFKSGSDTLGNAALLSGAVVASNRNTQEAGLGLLAFGLAAKIVSAATTPSADIRCWDNLPENLTFASLALQPGRHSATIDFLDAQGNPIPSLKKIATIDVVQGRDTVVFVSDQSHTSQTL
jgi:hypothetical protein